MILLVLLLGLALGIGMPVFALPSDGSESLKMNTRHLSHDGVERTYTLYLPASYDGKSAAPLLLLFHGGGGIGKRMVNFTGFDKICSEFGLIIVCPEGIDRHWNDGRVNTGHKAQLDNLDDVGFAMQIVDGLEKEFKIDPSRVYASGISNGAMMSYRLGLEHPERIAAIAPVVGALPEGLEKKQWSGTPVPAIIINGTKDPLVPFDGGEVHYFRKTLGRVLSVSDTVAFWAKRNQCTAAPQVSDLQLNSDKSGMKVKKTVYGSCCDGADIEFYAVEGGGHTWHRDSRLSQYLPAAVIGKACRDIDSTALIWSFFQRHKLNISSKPHSVTQEK